MTVIILCCDCVLAYVSLRLAPQFPAFHQYMYVIASSCVSLPLIHTLTLAIEVNEYKVPVPTHQQPTSQGGSLSAGQGQTWKHICFPVSSYCRAHQRKALNQGSILTKYVCTYVVGHTQECHAECHYIHAQYTYTRSNAVVTVNSSSPTRNSSSPAVNTSYLTLNNSSPALNNSYTPNSFSYSQHNMYHVMCTCIPSNNLLAAQVQVVCNCIAFTCLKNYVANYMQLVT